MRSGPGSDPAALPAHEVDRDLDDWGASRDWRAAARRVATEPLWRVWLRAEADGVEHVADEDGVLLAVHRSGPPWLALALVDQALAEEHPRRRQAVPALDPGLFGVPGASVALARLGAFPAVPANLERRLDLERALVSVLVEEGAGGRGLARAAEVGALRRGLLGAAVRAGAPVVPVVVEGLARAAPALGRPRVPGLGRLPIRLPMVDPALTPPLLPARVRVRFGPPIAPETGAGALDALAAATETGLHRLLAGPARGARRWRT